MDARITETFPDVPSIDTAGLSELMRDPMQTVVLLDVREPDGVSRSAIWKARYGRPRSTRPRPWYMTRRRAPRSWPTARWGYRSAGLVAELRERGVAGVYNLTGSIFRWANEDRPLYRGTAQARHVHPFDESWGTLLDADRRSYSP